MFSSLGSPSSQTLTTIVFGVSATLIGAMTIRQVYLFQHNRVSTNVAGAHGDTPGKSY